MAKKQTQGDFDSQLKVIAKSRAAIKDKSDKNGQLNSLIQGYKLLQLDGTAKLVKISSHLKKKKYRVSKKAGGLHLAIAKICLGDKANKNQMTKYGQILFAATQEKWSLQTLKSNIINEGLDKTAKTGIQLLKEAYPEKDYKLCLDTGLSELYRRNVIATMKLKKPAKNTELCLYLGQTTKGKTEVEIRHKVNSMIAVEERIAAFGRRIILEEK